MNPALQYALAFLLGRQRTYARLLDRLASARGDQPEHDRLCRMLLRKWNLNWEDGSRRSCVRDYGFLHDVLAEWTTHNKVKDREAVLKIEGLIEQLVAIERDESNYFIDGRMMRVTPGFKSVGLRDELFPALKALSSSP